MATYKGIKGFKVQSLASDPTASETIGKVFYNTAGYALKYSAEGGGAWSTGETMNTARIYSSGAGDSTATIVAGGGPGDKADSESYNGDSWTTTNSLTTARDQAVGCGSSTAALACGGNPGGTGTSLVEQWDGTNWTEIQNFTSARRSANVVGTTTAALFFGGRPAGGGVSNLTEEWNGTSWVEKGDQNTARFYAGGAGLSTSAITMGGQLPGAIANAETWDGTSWSNITNIPVALGDNWGAGTSNTLAFSIGGAPYVSTVNKWNGTSWTEGTAMTTGRGDSFKSIGGPTTSIMVATGVIGPPHTITDTTEEFNDPSYTIKTVTTS